jgi:hypothetical protein
VVLCVWAQAEKAEGEIDRGMKTFKLRGCEVNFFRVLVKQSLRHPAASCRDGGGAISGYVDMRGICCNVVRVCVTLCVCAFYQSTYRTEQVEQCDSLCNYIPVSDDDVEN